jgi:hypothetical protein
MSMMGCDSSPFTNVKIRGRVSMSRLHKVIYILREKYGVPLNLRYEAPPSIYSNDLEYDVGVLVAFGFLNIQIISRGDYVDRVYRVTEKGDRMLVDALKDGETEALFNNLNYVLRA